MDNADNVTAKGDIYVMVLCRGRRYHSCRIESVIVRADGTAAIEHSRSSTETDPHLIKVLKKDYDPTDYRSPTDLSSTQIKVGDVAYTDRGFFVRVR